MNRDSDSDLSNLDPTHLEEVLQDLASEVERRREARTKGPTLPPLAHNARTAVERPQAPPPPPPKSGELSHPLAESRAVQDNLQRFELGRVISGRYRLERMVAKGGMGRVFLATQIPLGRQVAIKVLIPQSTDKEFRKRFLLEASISARLVHRNIVTVHDYGETEDGDLYMAMEYLDGDPLSKVINRDVRLSNDRVCRVAIQICRALRAAHQKGVVHRDLKPSNVMLLRDEEGDGVEQSDFVKVLDFGLVKVFEPHEKDTPNLSTDLTRAGTLLGSPKYMAPEQIRCAPIDPRTDVYSLGVIMFHMLAGRPPFLGPTSVEILNQHLKEPTPSITAIVGEATDLAPELEVIVRRAMEKNPADRYPSMDDLLSDLKAAHRLISGASVSVSISSPGAVDENTNVQEIIASDLLESMPVGPAPVPPLLGPALGSSKTPDVGTLTSLPRASSAGAGSAKITQPTRAVSSSAIEAPFAEAIGRGSTALDSAQSVSIPPAMIDERQRSPRALVAGAAIVGIVLAGLMFVKLGVSGSGSGSAREEAPALVAPAAAQQTVTLKVASTPAGADVLIDGQVIGKTPLTSMMKREPSGSHKTLVFRLAGYEEATAIAELDAESANVQAHLVQKIAAPAPATEKIVAEPAAPAAQNNNAAARRAATRRAAAARERAQLAAAERENEEAATEEAAAVAQPPSEPAKAPAKLNLNDEPVRNVDDLDRERTKVRVVDPEVPVVN
jgi:eukaryotic-like serine/threonine-protein kinase